jgi:hypothetical protein
MSFGYVKLNKGRQAQRDHGSVRACIGRVLLVALRCAGKIYIFGNATCTPTSLQRRAVSTGTAPGAPRLTVDTH